MCKKTINEFNSYALRNKRDVLESLEDCITYYKETECEESERVRYIIEMLEKMLEEVKKRDLPQIKDEYYCYIYGIINGMMCLSIHYMEDYEIVDGELLPILSYPEEDILEIENDYITVQEYAKLCDVTDITVRQWIRRGKLRNIKKVNGEWKVAALADKPGRGYEDVSYTWGKLPKELLNKYTFLPMSGEMYITQDEEDKKKYNVTICDYETSDTDKVILSMKEREKFELEIIGCEDVEQKCWMGETLYIPPKRSRGLPRLRKDFTGIQKLYIVTEFLDNRIASTSFYADEEVGASWDGYDTDSYIIPFCVKFYSPSCENYNEEIAESKLGTYLGELRARLILTKQLLRDGQDFWDLCDSCDTDMEYMASKLLSENGPMEFDDFGGRCCSDEDVLYIDSLDFSDSAVYSDLKERILCELPWICKQFLHVFPDLMTYIVNENADEYIRTIEKEFYINNGFKQIDESNLLYVYTK